MTKSEEKYLRDHNMSEPPECYCGNPLRFIRYAVGYTKYCCPACANRDPEKIKKTKEHVLKKYGVDSISKLKEVREKVKQTCLERYGVENVSSSKEIREKVKQTNIKKYGVENAAQSEKIKEKAKQIFTNRYGVDHPSKLPDYLEKRKNTWLEKYGVEHISQLESTKQSKRNKKFQEILSKHHDVLNVKSEYGLTLYTCLCPNGHNFDIPSSTYYDRKRLNTYLCTICNPIGSMQKSSIEEFVKSILDKYKIHYIEHDRTILKTMELDFYKNKTMKTLSSSVAGMKSFYFYKIFDSGTTNWEFEV